LECDQCTGVTSIVLDGEHRLSVDCRDIDVFWQIFNPEDESTVTVFATCRKCIECFKAFGVAVPCCAEERDTIPSTLYATIGPAPGSEEEPGDAECTDADGEIQLDWVGNDPGGGGVINRWIGGGFPFPNCPTLRLDLELECRSGE